MIGQGRFTKPGSRDRIEGVVSELESYSSAMWTGRTDHALDKNTRNLATTACRQADGPTQLTVRGGDARGGTGRLDETCVEIFRHSHEILEQSDCKHVSPHP